MALINHQVKLLNDLADLKEKQAFKEYLAWCQHYNRILHHLYVDYIKTHPRIRINFEKFCSVAYNATLPEYNSKELKYKRPLCL